jgi:ABC-type phosphate transport system ATPase subunit
LTQEPNVFDGSIYENLTYALENSTIDEDSIRTIIESSQCQFIYNFPE